eukprot:8675129-Alexandrium_andersonii.AAC.1
MARPNHLSAMSCLVARTSGGARQSLSDQLSGECIAQGGDKPTIAGTRRRTSDQSHNRPEVLSKSAPMR